MGFETVEKLEKKFADLITQNQRLLAEKLALESQVKAFEAKNKVARERLAVMLDQLKMLQETS